MLFCSTDEEQINKCIEEVKQAEEEKRENMVGAEQAKIAEMEANIEHLKAVSIISVILFLPHTLPNKIP